MLFTPDDKKLLEVTINTTEKKEMLVRLLAYVMIGGTNVTAPEIRNCLMLAEQQMTPTTGKLVVSNKNQAV